MDQEKIHELKRRCISVIIDHLILMRRTDSIKDLPLPGHSLVQQIEGIYQYRRDLAVLLKWDPLDPIRHASVPHSRPFSDHYRWTPENKIDRRATAAAQLENFDPTTASAASVEFAFVLASTYCLEFEIRRLSPFYDLPIGDSSDLPLLIGTNPMVEYWLAVLGLRPNPNPIDTYLMNIRSQRQGSSDFWLTIIQSFWPCVEQTGVTPFRTWIDNVLRYAMEYEHKSIVDYVWTDDMRRKPLIRTDAAMTGNYEFLKWAVLANQKELVREYLDRLDNNDMRRAAVSSVTDAVCDDFYKDRSNLEIYERLLECLLADCIDISSSNVQGALCKMLYTLWDFLKPQKRARISNDFVDLLSAAIESGYVELATRVWFDEKEQFRKFEILFHAECAAFRSSCANGHTKCVRWFWEWASMDQQYRMIGCNFGDALKSAARNGHLSIVRYLWENMDSRVAYEAIDSHGIDEHTLCRLIVVASLKKIEIDASSWHELEDFLSTLIKTPSDGREPIYPLALTREIVATALLLDNGKALNVLVQRAKDRNDQSILRSLLAEFNNDQRLRLRSNLTTEDDIELCGLQSVQIVAMRLQAMTVQSVRQQPNVNDEEGEDDGEDDEDEEDEEVYGQVIDLTELDEYYEG